MGSDEKPVTPTEEQMIELARLRQWYPYRIVFGAYLERTGEWHTYADHTKRRMNRMLRDGWRIFQVEIREKKD